MRIEVVCASGKQPGWVAAGFEHYARRLTGPDSLTLREVPLGRRKGGSVERAIREEGDRLLAACGRADHVVALDERGERWTTADLARRLQDWAAEGPALACLIGGPDGLAPDCLAASRATWSLSPLTLPHGLARIVVAEALYRAVSLNRGHPYHRA